MASAQTTRSLYTAYLHALIAKHGAADRAVSEAQKSPSLCPTELRALKKRRLNLKDRAALVQSRRLIAARP